MHEQHNKTSSCSLIFSVSCLAAKIMSTHPRPFLDPHSDSGSTRSASLSFCILANKFPTTSSRLFPCQLNLSQHFKSPFFGMGILPVSYHLATLPHLLHQQILSHNSGPPYVMSSERMQDFPPALHFFMTSRSLHPLAPLPMVKSPTPARVEMKSSRLISVITSEIKDLHKVLLPPLRDLFWVLCKRSILLPDSIWPVWSSSCMCLL